jgi:hypothetical protein
MKRRKYHISITILVEEDEVHNNLWFQLGRAIEWDKLNKKESYSTHQYYYTIKKARQSAKRILDSYPDVIVEILRFKSSKNGKRKIEYWSKR